MNPFYISTPRLIVPQPLQVTIDSQDPTLIQNQNTVIGKVMLADSTDKDAFYRLRVSNPQTLFDANTIYNTNPLLFDYEITGNASVSPVPLGACMTHSVATNSTTNHFSAQQTHYYAHYQPGKSYYALFSFSFGIAIAGITRRVGFYDVNTSNNSLPENGVVLEQTSSGLSWVIYQGSPGNVVQTITQLNWNVDTFDGNGPSGYTLDVSKNCLGFVDLEWLGVGRVRCGFFVNGVPLVATVFNNTDQTLPYINNPYLPIRFEIRKTDNSTASGSMNVYCCSIISEGGYNPLGILISYKTATTPVSSGSVTPISFFSIRLQSIFPRAMLHPVSVEFATDLGGSTAIAYYTVYLWRVSSNPTGATWTNVGPTSISEYTTYNLQSQYSNSTSLIPLFRGCVNAISKISFSDIPDSLLFAQSSINKNFRDLIIVELDTSSVSGGGSKNYTLLFTWREIY